MFQYDPPNSSLEFLVGCALAAAGADASMMYINTILESMVLLLLPSLLSMVLMLVLADMLPTLLLLSMLHV